MVSVMDHPITDAPPLVADQPDEFEALRLALGRCVIAILNAAGVRGLPLPEVAVRLEAVAEIFEREGTRHVDQ
jgi:hypothetical protein